MNIGGFQKFSLSDFPGKVAAIVFTQGCNFRCPFCHNGALIPINAEESTLIPNNHVLSFLKEYKHKLDGVVITGGEPTIQYDIIDFLRELKAIGLEVKLDTNGSMPSVIKDIISKDLVDYIAMDIKAPLNLYTKLAGCNIVTENITQSIDIIANSGIEHEFRTTVVGPLLSPKDILTLQKLVPEGSLHRLQKFNPENALDESLRIEEHTHN